MAEQTITLGQHGRNIRLRNPLIAGPGTVGYGREHAKALVLDGLGAIITNTTTLHGRSGHPQPRLLETPAGVLMSTGLPNPGLRTVLHQHAAAWERLNIPIILSLAAEDIDAFVYCAGRAEESDSLAALELEPELLPPDLDMVRVVDKIRGITSLPLLVHLPVGSPSALSDAMTDLTAVGCDAVITGSPWPGLALDTAAGKPRLSGGVSGPAIRPLALRLIYDLVQLLGPEHIPLIAAGGISSAADVTAFLAAGASAVMLDTVLWVNPGAIAGMIEGFTIS